MEQIIQEFGALIPEKDRNKDKDNKDNKDKDNKEEKENRRGGNKRQGRNVEVLNSVI